MSRKHLFTSHLLLVIVGSTGSGKSDLAVRLARKFNGELVSADSRQVYKSMNIATNKLKPPRGIEQWMVNMVRPDEAYNLKQYQRAAMLAIKDVHKRGKLPILVGGTHFYFDALLSGLPMGVNANPTLREKLETLSTEELFTRVRERDPRRGAELDPQNRRRLIRALEIIESLGSVPSRQTIIYPIDEHMVYETEWIIIDPPREELCARNGRRHTFERAWPRIQNRGRISARRTKRRIASPHPLRQTLAVCPPPEGLAPQVRTSDALTIGTNNRR